MRKPPCFVFQLAGTAVFAIGLWLRFDPKTKGLFEGAESPYVFYTGKRLSVLELDTSCTIIEAKVKVQFWMMGALQESETCLFKSLMFSMYV